jgi:hypothetical protein
VIGQQKGRTTKETHHAQFGMPQPSYRKANASWRRSAALLSHTDIHRYAGASLECSPRSGIGSDSGRIMRCCA